jgi:hypothetical protein
MQGVEYTVLDSAPYPIEFIALSFTRYSIPLIKFVITKGEVVWLGDIAVYVVPPSVEYA